MKRRLRYIIIPILISLSISAILVINNLIVLSRIYYRTIYEINFHNQDELIDRVETFNYLQYLETTEGDQTHNLTEFDLNYIDREFINQLKNKINQDMLEFHLWYGHLHHFIYRFNATDPTNIYFSYSNSTIFNASYNNNEEFFNVDYSDYHGSYTGSWYMNFTYIPYISNESATILLENVILVMMDLKYDYLFSNLGGIFYQINQYVVLSSDLEIIFVYVPLTQVIVA